MWTISNRAVGVILTRRRLNETRKICTTREGLSRKGFGCAEVMNETPGPWTLEGQGSSSSRPTQWRSEMIVGYARVSTDGQTLDAQHATLSTAGAERVFAEKVSGAVTDRKAWRRQSRRWAKAMC